VAHQAKDFWPPGAFLKHLTATRGILRHRPSEDQNEFEIHSLDLTPLKLNLGYFTPFAIARHLSGHKTVEDTELEQLLPSLHEQVRRRQSPVVLVVGGRLSPECDRLASDYGAHLVAVLALTDIERIVNAPDQEAAWRAIAIALVKYLGAQRLSPYLWGRPAVGGRFFGRSEALTKAVGGKPGANVTIIGNRRIGKTSLLREIKGRLLRDNARLRTAEIYGNHHESAFSVAKELLVQLRPDLERRLASEPELTDNLPAHITAIPDRSGDDVALFVDELDHILEFDARDNYRLLHMLRASFEHERCRVFLAGFRRVMDAKHRLDTPLYNFTQAIELTSLTRHETEDMIRGPLGRLGIDVPAYLPEAIMHETNGHPELVQLFCSKVVEYYVAHGAAPQAAELTNEVVDDDMFRQTVYTAFLKNLNPFERLLSLSLIARAGGTLGSVDDYHFGLRECDEVMSSAGARLSFPELDALAENLRVGGIISRMPGKERRFKFAVPRLADYVLADDLEFAIRKTREDIATRPGPISLVMEPDPDTRDSVSDEW
jgi:hypothetical protein